MPRYDRLSIAAQGVLLDYIYALKDIDEQDRTTFEQQLLKLALRHDRNQQPKPLVCTCGEEDEAFLTLTDTQHSRNCPKYGM